MAAREQTPGTEKLYLNRELSWLDFNQRVLEEAISPKNPLFERLKFLAIVSSNLDEFFMVRVGSLHDRITAGLTRADASGYTPQMQLSAIFTRARAMIADMQGVYRHKLLPALRREDITVLKGSALDAEQRQWLEAYFLKEVYPVVTPMAVDSSRPFPLLGSCVITLGVLLRDVRDADEQIMALIPIPAVLPQLIELPPALGKKRAFVLLEDVVQLFAPRFFTGRQVLSTLLFRITRNADLTIDEDDADDLLQEIKDSLRRRRRGAVVRLQVQRAADRRLVDLLLDYLEIGYDALIEHNGPLNFSFLSVIYSLGGCEHLRYPPYIPQNLPEIENAPDMFSLIASRDVLIHVPYDSFEGVERFISEAAADPDVLAIKQTLYRVSGNSPIVRALARAAEAGKQVTALLEVRARFDEENNIHWAEQLERSGCHVIYGLVGYKTHCKVALVVRREGGAIRRYVHLGTGNYNDVTARVYTDFGLFTADELTGRDATEFFNMLTGYSQPIEMHRLVSAPHRLRERLLELIAREKQAAARGEAARIIAKMNALVDEEMIDALYEASCAGVRIDLIVRGICCLRPGVEGLSENIVVRSIVGRYLEHSRIFYFLAGGHDEVYLASADWMQRNLHRRVELMFPILDEAIKLQVIDTLRVQLKDNTKARQILPHGGHVPLRGKRGQKAVNAQDYAMAQAVDRNSRYRRQAEQRALRPIEAPQGGEAGKRP